MCAILQIVAAYLLIDLLTGIYHFVTDRGWNLAQQVRLFQDHHETNRMEGFDWQPSVAAVPALVFSAGLGYWPAFPGEAWCLALQPFLVSLSVLGILAQVPHYFAHHVPGGTSAWGRAVRFLQKLGVMISPQHHANHHQGDFDRNFCIFSGLNNYWLNPLLAWLCRSGAR